MVNRTEQPYWAFLYNDFILQTQPTKLQARLGPLEDAIVERLQHLDRTANSHAETCDTRSLSETIAKEN